MTADPCPFCEIVAGRLTAAVVDEDEDWIAFLNIGPAATGHTLVVPRSHVTYLWDLDPGLAAELGVAVQRVARRLEDRLRPDGLTVFQTNRAAGWQSVFHVHFHLVPRSNGDSLVPAWVEPLGDPGDLDAVAARLRD